MTKYTKCSLRELDDVLTSLNEEEMQNIVGAKKTYKFDTNGRLVNTMEDDEKGPNLVLCNGQSMYIAGDLNYASEQYKDEKENVHTGHTLSDGNMDLFYFLADNTNVEWGASYNVGSTAFLNTAHAEHSNYVSFQEGYSNYIHSHPTPGETQDQISSWDISTGVAMLKMNYKGKEKGTNPNYNYEKFSMYKAHSEGSVDEDTVDYTRDVRRAYRNSNYH